MENPLNLDHLTTLARAATEGVWGSNGEEVTADRTVLICECSTDVTVKRAETIANARFIAALNPQTALALIGRIRELEAHEAAALALLKADPAIRISAAPAAGADE